MLALMVFLLSVSTPQGGARGEALEALEAVLPSSLLGNLEDLVRVASMACDILPVELFVSALELPPLEVVEVTRSSRRAMRASSVLQRLRRVGQRELLLYVPGWWNTPSDEAAQGLVSALLEEHPTVLVLDTRHSFCRGYLSAATRVNAVSHLLYDFIKNLSNVGVSPSSVHLIGFSLGAHVAGMTGKLVQKGMKAKLGRITALDPAKPCFTRPEYRLQKTDAKFVHVVHSSAGVLGLEEPVGHADVYVNGIAVRQPECSHRSISFECDHNQAWKVFAASVRSRRALAARRCRAWRDLLAGRCTGDLALLGYGATATLRGMYLYQSGR